jgi:hypothetical protein
VRGPTIVVHMAIQPYVAKPRWATLFEHEGIGPNKVVRTIEAIGPILACVGRADRTAKDPRQNLATGRDPPLSLGS